MMIAPNLPPTKKKMPLPGLKTSHVLRNVGAGRLVPTPLPAIKTSHVLRNVEAGRLVSVPFIGRLRNEGLGSGFVSVGQNLKIQVVFCFRI